MFELGSQTYICTAIEKFGLFLKSLKKRKLEIKLLSAGIHTQTDTIIILRWGMQNVSNV